MNISKIILSLISIATMMILPSLNVAAQDKIWERYVIDDAYSGADGVRLADVNHDGLMDIATGWEEGGITKVYLHPGYQKVHDAWPSVIVGETPSVEDAVFADIDQNGVLDVISCTEGINRKIYINLAPINPRDYLDSAKWTSEVLPISDGLTQWMFAVPVQLDGLNGIDIVAGSKGADAKIGWFESPNKPLMLSDWKWHVVSPATWTMSLFIRDINQDGYVDIVTSDRKSGKTNGIRWLENPGVYSEQSQEWQNHFIGGQGTEVMFMDMADLDGDGLEDVIATEYTHQKIIYMRKLDRSGKHWKSFFIDIPEEAGRAKAVKVGDMNLDGNPDIVFSANTLGDPTKVGIIWMSYRSVVTDTIWDVHPLSGPEGYKFDRLELIDLDGDGDLDVLTSEENYGANSKGLGVIWYANPFL